MKIVLVIFIALALAGFSLLSLQMGVIAVPWRALLTDWQAGREYHYVLTAYRLPRLLLRCLSVQPSRLQAFWYKGSCVTLWRRRIFSA